MKNNNIIIIDYGSQYTQLIARRIREKNVYSEVLPHNVNIKKIISKNPSGIILSGGPASVYSKNSPKLNLKLLSLDVPILGICYGFGLLLQNDGAKIGGDKKREYGISKLLIKEKSNLIESVKNNSKVWMSHGDSIESLPKGWIEIAKTNNDVIAIASNEDSKSYGIQFHPEVVQTEYGNEIISNFLFNICKTEKNWTPVSFINSTINELKKKIGKKNILCAVSGGVDSTVMAKLIHEAVGDQLRAVFIDHGLLRKNEMNFIKNDLSKALGFNIECHDFSNQFLKKLKGVTNPEQKRKIIGEQFIRSFESVIKNGEKTDLLAQGTLYPDVIESGGFSGTADVIKSHHNVGGIPDDMNFKLIEPLRDLFKDEVRTVGRELRISKDFIGRHPFPGPGLGVRIIGEITNERILMLQEADNIFIQSLIDNKVYDEIWQAFAVLVPTRTVGVMGDSRTYGSLIALRAVVSVDGMTADWYRMPNEILEEVSSKIVNSVNGINRVVYDISSKPPSTIEWE